MIKDRFILWKMTVVHNFEGDTEVMFGNSFCFLFSKTCFWEYKEKTIFLYFEIKNMFS